MNARIISWNGKEFTNGLADLPAGDYFLEPVENSTDLTPEEDAGLREALDDVEAGHTVPLEDFLREISAQTAVR